MERMRGIDPARPPTPERAGWQPDPWGDGERYWDGERWTRSIRGTPAAPAARPGVAPGAGPRDFELEDEVEDDRPMRSGLLRGMVWAFAVVAIIAMLLAAVSIWPMLVRSPEPSQGGPQQIAAGLLHLTGSFTGSAHG